MVIENPLQRLISEDVVVIRRTEHADSLIVLKLKDLPIGNTENMESSVSSLHQATLPRSTVTQGSILPKLHEANQGTDQKTVRSAEIEPEVSKLVADVVQALLDRASQSKPAASPFELQIYEELEINRPKRRVRLKGRELPLTPIEFDLLTYLAERQNQIVTKEELLQNVWQVKGTTYTKTVTTHMNRLRIKLGDDAAEPTYIHTERAVGYRFGKYDTQTAPRL